MIQLQEHDIIEDVTQQTERFEHLSLVSWNLSELLILARDVWYTKVCIAYQKKFTTKETNVLCHKRMT